MTAQRDESIVDAAKRMADHGVGDLVVVEETRGELPRPIGIVTDRDLVVRVLARAAPGQVTVGDVMERELVTATEDDDVETVLAKLRRHAIRRIPIVDRGGRLQGIVSLDDVIEWLSAQLRAATALVDTQSVRPDVPRPR